MGSQGRSFIHHSSGKQGRVVRHLLILRSRCHLAAAAAIIWHLLLCTYMNEYDVQVQQDHDKNGDEVRHGTVSGAIAPCDCAAFDALHGL